MFMGVFEVYDIKRENSKNKRVRKNAVTRAVGRFSLPVMGSCKEFQTDSISEVLVVWGT